MNILKEIVEFFKNFFTSYITLISVIPSIYDVVAAYVPGLTLKFPFWFNLSFLLVGILASSFFAWYKLKKEIYDLQHKLNKVLDKQPNFEVEIDSLRKLTNKDLELLIMKEIELAEFKGSFADKIKNPSIIFQNKIIEAQNSKRSKFNNQVVKYNRVIEDLKTYSLSGLYTIKLNIKNVGRVSDSKIKITIHASDQQMFIDKPIIPYPPEFSLKEDVEMVTLSRSGQNNKYDYGELNRVDSKTIKLELSQGLHADESKILPSNEEIFLVTSEHKPILKIEIISNGLSKRKVIDKVVDLVSVEQISLIEFERQRRKKVESLIHKYTN